MRLGYLQGKREERKQKTEQHERGFLLIRLCRGHQRNPPENQESPPYFPGSYGITTFIVNGNLQYKQVHHQFFGAQGRV